MPASHSPRRQTDTDRLFASQTKKGPRRYHREGFTVKADNRERSALRRDPDTRNPFKVHEKKLADVQVISRRVEQLPVRMKLPRLRRLKRSR